jgi:hypothetical protein
MKFPWFKQSGILFIPVSIPGWLLLAAAVISGVFIFWSIDSNSHSASDTLRPFIIFLVIIFVAYSLIGFVTSRK